MARYELPLLLGSDTGPVFIGEMVQELTMMLKIKVKVTHSLPSLELWKGRVLETDAKTFAEKVLFRKTLEIG